MRGGGGVVRLEFRSADELFEAVRALARRLEETGHASAAAELRAGFGLLNGLTDGWASFLESIDKVRVARLPLGPEERRALEDIRSDVRAIVRRR
jgi:hypothetical protein